MNETTDIPAILRGKPQGTKLHDLVRGTDVFLNNVVDGCDKVCCTFVKNGSQKLHYSSKGTLVGFEDGMVILVPSKSMRDWEKFAWKKGDVLVNSRGLKILFDRWANDKYTSFYAKTINLVEDAFLDTNLHTLASEKEAKSFVKCIEEKLGGKLNLETLEIEKQPEFKDGDIVCISGMGYLAYGIVKSIDNSSKKLEYYVLNDMSTLKFEDWLSFEDKQIQPITETQQIILFDALAKQGKAWDAEKKQVVRLQVSGKLYYFEMENELAYIAKLKEAKGGKYTFESNVSWCPRNSTNGYDNEGSLLYIGFTRFCVGPYSLDEINAMRDKNPEVSYVEPGYKNYDCCIPSLIRIYK